MKLSQDTRIRIGNSLSNMHTLLGVKILSTEFNTDFAHLNTIYDEWQLLCPKLESRSLQLDIESLASNTANHILQSALNTKLLKLEIYQDSELYISGDFYIQNLQVSNKPNNLEHLRLKLTSNGKFIIR